MQYSEMTLDAGPFSSGSLLGTSGNSAILKQMAAEASHMAISHFGSERDPIREGQLAFTAQITEPIRRMASQLQQTRTAVQLEDRILPITNIKELERGVPSCMWMHILTDPPIRDLVRESRIDAWGLKDQDLPEEDVAGRLINNGRADLVKGAPCWDKTDPDSFWTTEIYASDDPRFTDDELVFLEQTREFFENFLLDPDTEYLDPTDYPRPRG